MFDKAVVLLTAGLYSWEAIGFKSKPTSFCGNELDCMWSRGTTI